MMLMMFILLNELFMPNHLFGGWAFSWTNLWSDLPYLALPVRSKAFSVLA